MKKVVKLISLFILLLIINVGVVRAANKCGNVTITANERAKGLNNTFFGGAQTFSYNFKINNSTTVTAYCHNPGVHAFDDNLAASTGVNMGCASLIFDPTGNVDINNIFGIGLMYILDSGKSYNIIYIAENMYEMLFPIKNTKSYESTQVKYLKYYINKNFKTINEDLKKLGSYVGVYNIITGKFNGNYSACNGGNCASDNEITEAINLVKDALKVARIYANGDVKTPTTALSSPIQTRTLKNKAGKEENVNKIIYNIDVKDFPKYDESKKNTPSVSLDFSCSDCTKKGVTTKILLNNKSIKANDLKSTNLLKEYAKSGKGKIKFELEFTSDADNCEDISYSIKVNYEYKSSSVVTDNDALNDDEQALVDKVLKALNKTGYEVGECTSHRQCQGFYVLDNSGSNNNSNNNGNTDVEINRNSNIEKKLTINNTINTCKTTGGPGEPENICPSKISNVDCVACEENSHTVEIKEGYTYANDNSCDTSGEQLNISKCIVDEKAADALGNRYKNTELSDISKKGGANVYCKEDFSLTLPGSKKTEPGRYFPLDPTTIEGTKSCYSSKYNDLSQLEAELEENADNQMKVYNAYAKVKAFMDCLNDGSTCEYVPGDKGPLGKGVLAEKDCTMSSTSTSTITLHTDECTRRGGEVQDTNCSGLGSDRSCDCKFTSTGTTPGKLYKYGGTLTLHWEEYSTCGNPTPHQESFQLVALDETGDENNCHLETDYDENIFARTAGDAAPDFLKEKIKEILGEASNITWTQVGDPSKGYQYKASGTAGTGLTGEVEIGEGVTYNLIEEWNNSFDWTMEYDFEPKVHFWYQEEYMYKPKTDLMEETAKQDLTDYNKSILYCTGTVSDNYEDCINGNWTKTIPKKTLTVCSCNPNSGCSSTTREAYNAKYVKQYQKKSITYQAPNGFYSRHPYADVLVANPGQSDKMPNSTELDHVLPVSMNTIGTRNYMLWVDGLGEYYNKESNKTNDTTGRIWGSNNNVLTALLKKGEDNKCYNTNSALVSENTSRFPSIQNSQNIVHDNGVYVCKYSTICSNICKWKTESTDGKTHCKDGSVCDSDEQYYKECTSCFDVKGQEETTGPRIGEDGKRYYYNQPSDPGEDKIFKDGVTQDALETQCSNNKPTCDWNNGKPKCKDGESCTPEEYYKQCTSCSNPRQQDKKYYYYNQPSDPGEDGLHDEGLTLDEKNNQCNNQCNWNNGKPKCNDGESCTPEEYYKQCTSCSNPRQQDNKYYYYNQSNDPGADGLHDEGLTLDEKNNQCKDSEPDKCDWNNGKPKCKDGKSCTPEEYYKQCTSCYKEPDLGHPGPLSVGNDLFTFFNQSYDDGTDGLYEKKTAEQLKAICCPDCPPDDNLICSFKTDENGKTTYYDNNGKPITGKNEEDIIAKQKAVCCPDGDCPTICTYCLYDGNKLNIQYRPITSEDLNPNDRDLGINWKWDNSIDTTMELKAFVTTDEIEKSGDEIFNLKDSDFDNNNGNDDEFAVKVKMDASLISKLRDINKSKGFASNTLECYDYNDSKGNALYENIYCYSTVIDTILKDNKLKNNIVFTVKRPLTEAQRKKNEANENYFTNFATKEATAWDLRTGMSLAIAKEKQDKFGIEIDRKNGRMTDYHVGPSWK